MAMFKKWLSKFRKVDEKAGGKEESKEKSTANDDYPNRFVKFYHQNQERLNNERRGSYTSRKKGGICVRCRRKALPGIVFCDYHQAKQKEYNLKAREK